MRKGPGRRQRGSEGCKKPERAFFLSPYFRITCIIRNIAISKTGPPSHAARKFSGCPPRCSRRRPRPSPVCARVRQIKIPGPAAYPAAAKRRRTAQKQKALFVSSATATTRRPKQKDLPTSPRRRSCRKVSRCLCSIPFYGCFGVRDAASSLWIQCEAK